MAFSRLTWADILELKSDGFTGLLAAPSHPFPCTGGDSNVGAQKDDWAKG